MELLVATWTVRFAFIGALGVAGISLAAGSAVPDAVIRSAFVAFVFTLGGRLLIGFLETPDQRLVRLRRERVGRQAGAGKPGSAVGSSPAAGKLGERAA
jgi:hypothetical protein